MITIATVIAIARAREQAKKIGPVGVGIRKEDNRRERQMVRFYVVGWNDHLNKSKLSTAQSSKTFPATYLPKEGSSDKVNMFPLLLALLKRCSSSAEYGSVTMWKNGTISLLHYTQSFPLS